MKLHRSAVFIILLAGAGCLLIPDDQEKGTRVVNERPSVQITAGAANSDSAGVDYKVGFQWRGSDNDGMVIRFQYAVDDTTTERAWTDTTAYGALIKFRASHTDQRGGGKAFHDWHTFYLRAVDNEYATSRTDRRYFNATTIAPQTHITFPTLTGSAPTFPKTFTIEWEGEDLDSSAPDRKPAFYEYKLIRDVPTYDPDTTVVNAIYTAPNVFLDAQEGGDKSRWIRVAGGTHELQLRDMDIISDDFVYVFAVRAVDEAGAVQPDLVFQSNWIKFHIGDAQSRPNVTVRERSLGEHTWPSDGQYWRLEVPSNTPIRFKWTGDASWYGSKPGNVNYGLDVPDPQDDRYRNPNGIGGWIGWGKWTEISQPLIFPDTENGQQHVFYVRMRDAGDSRQSEQLCTIIMTVVAFSFSRPALLVDDAKVGYGLGGRNQDAIHDEFVGKFIGRIKDYTGGVLDERSLYSFRNNPEGLNPTENTALKLSELALYSSLLWSYNYNGGRSSGIWYHEREKAGQESARRLLSSYLSAGGKLFLFGGRPLSAVISPDGNAGADYPKQPPQAGSDAEFEDDTFVWKFLHVRSQIVGIDPLNCSNTAPNDHQTWRDGLVRCISQNPAYPDLVLDPDKYNTERLTDCQQAEIPIGGIVDYEGVLFERQYAPLFPEAGLDTLYKAETYDWVGAPPSYWNGSVIAQRYQSTAIDTLRGTTQGRVVLFLFQPFPFEENPAVDAGTAAINWLMTGQDY
jgi:hypothetical protein